MYIEENLAKGYIYEGSSPYTSSFFFRKKTDGGLRPIIDYRPLNAWTVKDTYPLPLISDILTNLSGKKVFCYVSTERHLLIGGDYEVSGN